MLKLPLSSSLFTTPSVVVLTPSVRQTPNWHGHVTAVTCAPSHRRLGLAAKLMSALEEISEKKHCFFVDLFVRVSNLVAINMYKALGYTIYRKALHIHELCFIRGSQ